MGSMCGPSTPTTKAPQSAPTKAPQSAPQPQPTPTPPLSSECSAGQSDITLFFKFDDFPDDISWTVTNSQNVLVAETDEPGFYDDILLTKVTETITVCRVKPSSPGNDLVNKWWNASASIRMVPLLPVSITIVRMVTMTMMTKIIIMTTNPHARMTQHSNGLITKERQKNCKWVAKKKKCNKKRKHNGKKQKVFNFCQFSCNKC